MKPGPRKWLVLDGPTIIGRIYSCEPEQAMRLAKITFPELEDSVIVKLWDLATNKERASAKRAQFISPEILQKLGIMSAE